MDTAVARKCGIASMLNSCPVIQGCAVCHSLSSHNQPLLDVTALTEAVQAAE